MRAAATSARSVWERGGGASGTPQQPPNSRIVRRPKGLTPRNPPATAFSGRSRARVPKRIAHARPPLHEVAEDVRTPGPSAASPRRRAVPPSPPAPACAPPSTTPTNCSRTGLRPWRGINGRERFGPERALYRAGRRRPPPKSGPKAKTSAADSCVGRLAKACASSPDPILRRAAVASRCRNLTRGICAQGSRQVFISPSKRVYQRVPQHTLR